MRILRPILLCSLILFAACTGNSLFDDNISVSENRTLKGRVLLLHESNYAGTYVWLEGFNDGTFTDSDGNFRFDLPEPSAQPGGGLNGIFNVYFYCANFKIEKAAVLMLNGNIEQSRGDVNADGRIYPDIVLTKLLEMRTRVSPDTLYEQREDTVITTVYLENLVDTVRIRTYRGNPDALIVLPENGAPSEATIFPGRQTVWTEEVITTPLEYTIVYSFLLNFFQPGVYNFIPILEIVQPGIPDELLYSLGTDVYGLSSDYLALPFRRQNGHLTIVSNSN